MSKTLLEVVRIITILNFAWILKAEKIYFARYLNTELFTLRFHKVVGESVSSCIDKCKASNNCNYINYHVTSHLCHLIDGNIGHGVTIEDILEQARGYVFGNKANWTETLDSGCLSCPGDGKCTLSTETGKESCPVSGCMPPDPKPDATLKGNMHYVGNKVKYVCTGQLKMAGARQRISTCLESGNWSSTDFQCVLDFTCRRGDTWEYAAVPACDCVVECSEVTNRSCLCTEYQERFISFPNQYIENNHIGEAGNDPSEESCSALCRVTPGCRSADIVMSKCYMNSVMPHEVNPTEYENRHLTLRMCDPCN